MNSQTQRITWQGEAGAIEGLLDQPEGAALGVAVVAHPHPLFGGTMDNKVVQTLARAFVQCGWTVVRFNFRGVGASEGVHELALLRPETFCRLLSRQRPRVLWRLQGFLLAHLLQAMSFKP